MRIGIDGRLWNETGVGRYIRNLVKNLVEIDTKNEYCLFVLTKDLKQIQNSEFRIQNKNWKIIPADMRWHSFDEQLRFPQLLYKEKLDLMHFPYFSLPIGYMKPFVITLHDLILHHFPTGKASTLPLPVYKVKHLVYRQVMAHGLRHAQKIIVPLDATRDELIKTFGISEKKVVITKEGYDPAIKKNDNESKTLRQLVSDNRYFLYVGNAYPHKNLDRLLAAFARLQDEYESQKAKLFFVGKEDYFYQKLEKKYRGNDAVVFLHHVTDNELALLYGNAMALVSPSLMEGFGLPQLEAMANSCLVIASHIPAVVEVCSSAAVYFDPLDITDIMKKLIAVYNLDHVSRESRITQGLQRVTLFSWKEMAKETLAVYESSISIRSGQ